MSASVAEAPASTSVVESQQPKPAVDLHVRVADAQGLRLYKGGDIRLVITLRSIEDTEGAAFGLKVTPWQEVPQNCAPTWRPREAIFNIPAERCFSAEFVDSAHLHMALMQKGHEHPNSTSSSSTTPAAAAPALGGFGFMSLKPEGFAAALQGAVAAVQGALEEAVPDRGECVGTLRLPLGRRLVCPEDTGGMDGITWVQLVEPNGDGGQKAKGSLLLELSIVQRQLVEPRQAPCAASAVQPQSPLPTASSTTKSPPSPLPTASSTTKSPPSTTDTVSTPIKVTAPSQGSSQAAEDGDDLSDTESDSEAESDLGSQVSTSTPGEGGEANRSGERSMERPLVERPTMLLQPGEDPLASTPHSEARSSSNVKWLASDKARSGPAEFDSGYCSNIFTINNPNASASQESAGVGAAVLNKLFKWPSRRKAKTNVQERIRSALDPSRRKQRKEVRRWRRWHEVFRVLNTIDHKIAEVVSLLVQAAASMRQFGDCHSRLADCARLSAFLRDAALYFKSESDIPKRLETHLDDLEKVADTFRSISVELAQQAKHNGTPEMWKSCEDLQVDIAVLLESAQMTAQHALAEYKKMHCRLELLVTEYEPICRLELEDARPANVTFLPLLTDESAKQVSDASVPEEAVQWAVDFSQLVGASSKDLHEYVRELDHRAKQVSACSQELRNNTLQLAASAPAQEKS